MFDIGERYELEFLEHDGGHRFLQGVVIGRDGVFVQIETATRVCLVNTLTAAFVSARHLGAGPSPPAP